MNYKTINPTGETLTIEKLRTFSGYENYTDEQAQEVVDTLEKLATLLYDYTFSKNNHSIDNQQVVYLNSDKNNLTKKIAA